MKRASILLMLVSFSFAFAQAQEAPFGLTWGMHYREVAKVSEGLMSSGDKNSYFFVCDTKNVPKNHTDADYYALVFSTKDSSLVKISMLGKDIEDDPFGNEGRKIFDRISKQLRTKYDFDSEVKFMGRALYDGSDEFYQCLNYSGCGLLAEIFEKGGTAVSLTLEGQERGKGFIKITFESVLFSKRIAEMKMEQNKINTDAF